VVFTSTRAGSTPEAIAEASDGAPAADELEPAELDDPDPKLPPKGKLPEPKGKLPEPDEPEGRLVDGCWVDEVLECQATRPTPNPAAMASTITNATTVTVQPTRERCWVAGLGCGGCTGTQYGPE
jgi:hypothetical protein